MGGRPPENPADEGGSDDDVRRLFETYGWEYRRQTVRYFRESGETVASLDDLVDHVVEATTGEPDRERIATQLHHVSLPKLDDAGVVEYDFRTHTARCRDPPRLEDVLARLAPERLDEWRR